MIVLLTPNSATRDADIAAIHAATGLTPREGGLADTAARLVDDPAAQGGCLHICGGRAALTPEVVAAFCAMVDGVAEYAYADLAGAGFGEISFEHIPANDLRRIAGDKVAVLPLGMANMAYLPSRRAVFFDDHAVAAFVRHHFQSPDGVFAYPVSLTTDPSAGCNLKCVMCHFQVTRAPTERRGPHVMSAGVYARLANEIAGWKRKPTVELGFRGEPLLNKHIVEIVDNFCRAGAFTVINTNLLLADATLLSALASSGLGALTVSIDGVTPESYEAIRLGGKFDDLMRNFDLAREICGKAGVKLQVRMVRMKENFDQMDSFFEKFLPISDGVVVQNEVVFRDGKYYADHMFGYHEHMFCSLPFTSLAVASSGGVYACGSTTGEDQDEQLGDINHSTLLEVWRGEKMMELRRQTLALDVQDPYQCVRCSRQVCASGVLSKEMRDDVLTLALEGATYSMRWQ